MLKTIWRGFRIVSFFCLCITLIIGFGVWFPFLVSWLMTHGHRVFGWSCITVSALAIFTFVCYVIGIFETI
jgi:hypothetical protein